MPSFKEPKRTSALPTKNNIVLISLDTLRADYLNSYGYRKYKTTPNIDRLVEDGILFENAITAAPWTIPSHLSLFTSLYPSQHGMIFSFKDFSRAITQQGKFLRLPDNKVTLAELLEKHGYDTGAFTSGGPLTPEIGFDQGFKTYATSMYKINEDNFASMIKWLESPRKTPFFLFWHTFEIHAPYLETRFLDRTKLGDKFDSLETAVDTLKQATPKDRWPEDFGNYPRYMVDTLKKLGLYNKEISAALYAGGVRSADEWVGKLIFNLKRLKQYNETIVIVLSDHGEEFGDHFPQYFYDSHGHSLFDEIVHVPLIIKLPDNRYRGTRVPQMTRLIDVMPTLIDLLNISGTPTSLSGRSLSPLWRDSSLPDDREIYLEALASEYEQKGLRNSRQKFFIHIDEEAVSIYGRNVIPQKKLPLFLYDLLGDPRETKNLLRLDRTPKIIETALRFDVQVRRHVSKSQASATETKLDRETVQKIKALGYLE